MRGCKDVKMQELEGSGAKQRKMVEDHWGGQRKIRQINHDEIKNDHWTTLMPAWYNQSDTVAYVMSTQCNLTDNEPLSNSSWVISVIYIQHIFQLVIQLLVLKADGMISQSPQKELGYRNTKHVDKLEGAETLDYVMYPVQLWMFHL